MSLKQLQAGEEEGRLINLEELCNVIGWLVGRHVLGQQMASWRRPGFSAKEMSWTWTSVPLTLPQLTLVETL